MNSLLCSHSPPYRPQNNVRTLEHILHTNFLQSNHPPPTVGHSHTLSPLPPAKSWHTHTYNLPQVHTLTPTCMVTPTATHIHTDMHTYTFSTQKALPKHCIFVSLHCLSGTPFPHTAWTCTFQTQLTPASLQSCHSPAVTAQLRSKLLSMTSNISSCCKSLFPARKSEG